MTIAEKISEILGDDGVRFMAPDGRTLADLAREFGAEMCYAQVIYDDEGNKRFKEHHDPRGVKDRVRYGFPDGSAIVEAGDAWDIEGAERFSWEGA